MTETRWWWIRHAPVTVNQGRIYGQNDHPCDTDDPPTFQALARLVPADAVWVTSTLLRTVQTAEAIRAEMAPPPTEGAEAFDAFKEQSFGDWQGKTYEEAKDGSLGSWHRFWLAPAETAPPGGESFVDLHRRVAAQIHELNERYRGRDIVAVTHGGTIRAALCEALAIPHESALRLQIDNCSLTRIDSILGPIGSHAPNETQAWRVEYSNLSPRRLTHSGAMMPGSPA